MNKLFPLALALVLLACTLTLASCATPASARREADEARLTNNYTIQVTSEFTSDREGLPAEGWNDEFYTITVSDGNLFSAHRNVSTQTLVDDVLYDRLVLLGMDKEVLKKATLTADERAHYFDKTTSPLPLRADRFEASELTKKDGREIITCTGIAAADVAKLADWLPSELQTPLQKLTPIVEEVSCVITLKDGRFETVAVICPYTVTWDKDPFTLTMILKAAYSYEAVETITAPANAEAYENTTFIALGGYD